MSVVLRRRVAPLLAVLAALGCDDDPLKAREPRATASASSALPSGRAPADSGAPAIIGALRKEKLDVGTRAMSAESIAFAKAKFIHLGETALFINELPSKKLATKVPVKDPRRLVVLGDGSALALCTSETLLVTRRKYVVVRLARIPMFPQSKVLPDLNRKRRFWVLHAFDPALYGYELDEDDRLVTLDVREIKDFDRRVFALLKDGSYLHTTSKGLVRMYLAGKRQAISVDSSDVFRLLPSRRLDRVWLARDTGKLELVQLLGGRSRAVSAFSVESIFDVASADTKLATLRVSRKSGKRVFAVELHTTAGKLLWSETLALGIDQAQTDDWVARLARNRSIAVSRNGKWLAVGGPSSAVLWDADKAKRMLER